MSTDAPLVQRFPNGVVLTKFTEWVLDFPDGRHVWYKREEIEHITLLPCGCPKGVPNVWCEVCY